MFLDDRRGLASDGQVQAAQPVDVGAPPLAATGVVSEGAIGTVSALTESASKNFTVYTRACQASVGEFALATR